MTTLTVSIQGANDAPVLAALTGSQNAIVGSAFSLVLPARTFTDVDAGDTLAPMRQPPPTARCFRHG